MFKIGDKVVCVYSGHSLQHLSLYKEYTISKLSNWDNEIYISNICWAAGRFISLQEYRKLKLEKLCLNQEIK